jgi:hypothetical protein
MTELTEEQAQKYQKRLRMNPAESRLKFAYLKETLSYRKFYKANIDILLAVLCNKDTLAHLPQLQGMNEEERRNDVVSSFIYKIKEIFSINADIFLNWIPDLSLDKLLCILDPDKDITELKNIDLTKVWPLLFSLPGVHPVTICIGEEDKSISYITSMSRDAEKIDNLKPYEQFIKVDYRRKKSDLMNHFSISLDMVKDKTTFPDTSRMKRQGMKQLKIYKMHKYQKKSFVDIAYLLTMNESDVKMSYRSAKDMLNKIDDYIKENSDIKEKELNCLTCQERNTCKELCDELLEEQGKNLPSGKTSLGIGTGGIEDGDSSVSREDMAVSKKWRDGGTDDSEESPEDIDPPMESTDSWQSLPDSPPEKSKPRYVLRRKDNAGIK